MFDRKCGNIRVARRRILSDFIDVIRRLMLQLQSNMNQAGDYTSIHLLYYIMYIHTYSIIINYDHPEALHQRHHGASQCEVVSPFAAIMEIRQKAGSQPR